MTEVDAFLDDLDRLAATAPTDDPGAFYRQLLGAAALAVGADAADFTSVGRSNEPPALWPAENGKPRRVLLDAARVQRLGQDGVPRVVTGADDAAVIACPVEGAAGVAGVLALRLTADPVAVERSVELAAGVAEIAGRYELRRESHHVAAAETRLARVEEALVRLHSLRNLAAIAREAADQGRLLADCDRVAVLARSGSGWRLLAASGVSSISRRSDAARRLERLTQVALRGGDPLIVPAPTGAEGPAVIADEVDAYRDATGVRSLRALPCVALPEGDAAAPPARLALVAESFDASIDPAGDALLAALAKHVGVAAQRERRPWATNRIGRAALIATLLAVAAIGVGVTLVTSATLWVRVDGQFEPVARARVFAPLDGVVEEVLVRQSDEVTAGTPLLRLASPELRVQQEEVAEAIAATESELAALETAKLRAATPGRNAEDSDPTTLASRVAALRERLGYQQRRRDLLDAEAAKLLVISPLDGKVVSWRPEDYLADRPVRRGQRLLEVVADNAWRLELEAPDHRSGPVLRAAGGGRPLAVEYVVRADPSQTHRGEVADIAETTHVNEQGEPVVRVVVVPDDASVANPRSGLGVSAKIDCGEHSLAYVWLHEAIDAIRRRLF